MPIYDQNQVNNTTPWYAPSQPKAPTQTAHPQNAPVASTAISQFAWITNPGVIDMWPMAPGSEMTFINNDTMKLYIKRVDEYGHPFKTRRFSLVEEFDEATDPAPKESIDLNELKQFMSSEIEKAVSNKMSNMFSFKLPEQPNKGDNVNV